MQKRRNRVIVLPLALACGIAGCQPGRSGILTAPAAAPFGAPGPLANASEAAPEPAIPPGGERTIASLSRKRKASVTLRDGSDAAEFTRRMAARGFRVRRLDGKLGLAAVEGATQADLAADPAVAGTWDDSPRRRVKPVRLVPQPLVPADPMEDLQWGLEAVKARQAWQAGATGRGVRVAIVDTGIDPDNPDLADNVDFALSRSLVPGEDLVDRNGHGSHVAGIVAAARNGIGVVGVAPEATIIVVKVLDQNAYGDDFTIIQGVRYAADAGAKIINMSIEARFAWGSPEAGQAALAFNRAVRYAAARGALVVAGTGNDAEEERVSGWTHLPAASPWVLGVSAVGPVAQQNFLDFAIYSNYGRSLVDVAAPGGGMAFDPAVGPYIADPRDLVMSTWSTHAVPHVVAGVPLGPAPWSYFAGTSMACAFATGVAALAAQAHGDRGAALASRVMRTASGPGFNPYLGRGVVDARRAVASH